MKTPSYPKFQYNFRAPGSQVEGPIKFAIGQTVLGVALVGRSQRGICAIFLGDDAQSLRDQLAGAFPGVELHSDKASLRTELGQVLAFIGNSAPAGLITLDVGGTYFEQKVWKALCSVPAGETRSYSEIAMEIGAPGAVRAVANACAANLLAIAIPCHRVVRSNGSISGYRWGVERKRALLADERIEAVA